MIRKILLGLMCIGVIGFIIFVNISSRMEYNDDFVVGNTAGNLMNDGLFCENKDRIYFSNTNDNNSLYSMSLDCTDFKKLSKSIVSEINCAGKYIYYVSKNKKYKDKNNSNSFASALSSGGIGLYRCTLNGNHPTALYNNTVGKAALSGNYLYYQHYSKEKGVEVYKVKIDETEGTRIFASDINPVGIHNGNMYFAETQDNHSINKMSLTDDSYEPFYDGNCANVIAFENYIYFLDLDNDYALTRINSDGTSPEVIVNDRVLTYNFSTDGNYLYYQLDKQDESCICQMNLTTRKENVLLKGNFSNINVTSRYVFFQEFDTSKVYVIEVGENPTRNLFNPPVKK